MGILQSKLTQDIEKVRLYGIASAIVVKQLFETQIILHMGAKTFLVDVSII